MAVLSKFQNTRVKYKIQEVYTGFYGDKILYKTLQFFDKIFVPTFCRRRFRNALYGKKILSMGREMLCLGTVLTNLFRLFYAGGIQSWKWQRFFLDTGEICKRRQSCCSTTVPRTVKHRHQRMWRFCRRSRIVGG